MDLSKPRIESAIRPATLADVPELLEMIRELAHFERLEDQMETTVESLETALFGSKAVARALLATVDGATAGYAIYFFTFSSFVGRRGLWLDDVYVRPSFRQQGLGKALIKAVARVAAEHSCGRMEWTALNWNRHALEFYRALGLKVMDEWVLLRLDADGIGRMAKSPNIAPP
jgi:GNAT superfamily N-acetyltransferase